MNKPIYKKWWFIALAAIVVLMIISIFIPKQPGAKGKEIAHLVSDSLKRCQSPIEIANWYTYVKEQLAKLDNEEDRKVFQSEISKMTPSSSSNENSSNDNFKWKIEYYVDDFGEKTNNTFLTYSPFIKGVFSNTATTNSDLNVKIFINDSLNIYIKLYEYAGDNPVKAITADKYNVLIKDKDGEVSSITANNYSDRLMFDAKPSLILHKILLKGGHIKFRIVHSEYNTNEYQFDIPSADGYQKAYNDLMLTKK